jgi:hypothetical protein
VFLLSSPAAGAQPEPAGSLTQVPVPGGLPAALATIADKTTPERAQFLIEFIRRTHDTTGFVKDAPRADALRVLLAHLDRAAAGSSTASDTVPLPLTVQLWTDVVFRGAATPRTLVTEILRSRSASLLYTGLLSLDDGTRAWIAGQRDLLSDLAVRHAAVFMTAAPGIRVAGGVAQGPGGDDARHVWEALAGRRGDEPAEFIRSLITQREGRLAYFVGAMALLSAAERRAAFQLDAPDRARQVAAARRLLTLFERVAPGWKVAERVFWRPALDPALLISDLRTDAEGRTRVPGTKRFWNAVLAPTAEDVPLPPDATIASDEPADLVWLCERVFEEPVDHRRRYQIALYASRLLDGAPPGAIRDTIEAVRASSTYPALTAAFERARLRDPGAIAAAARRATQLVGVGEDANAVRTLAQYQGLLALLTRAASRHSLSPSELAAAITSVSAIDPGPRGEYDGRIVRWLLEWCRARRARADASPANGPSAGSGNGDYRSDGGLERELLRLLAGPEPVAPRAFEWEGTRYRVDLTAAELARLTAFLGEHPRPYLTVAAALSATAHALAAAPVTAVAMRPHAAAVAEALRGLELPDDEQVDDLAARQKAVVEAVDRLASPGAAVVSRAVSALREFADHLVARGLTEMVYATALGQPDSIAIPVGEAAARHDFGLASSGTRRRTAWQLPVAGADSRTGWRVTGSLLGLDVRLAEFALMRLSNRPPPRRPTLNDEDRRVFVESAAVIDPYGMSDAEAASIVSAIRRGRTRLGAVRSAADVETLATDLSLSPARRTLLAWTAAHDPARVPAFMSASELLWIGLEPRTPVRRFDAWGVSAESRLGCLCAQMIDGRPWETVAGRWTWGMMASVFPDLNLRLTEVLADLGMPAILVGPLLAPATLELVNGVTSRDPDDRRALVEFVQGLGRTRVEDFLALLTTDGPLVPVEDRGTAARAAGGRP